jgi:hypothetical protein
MQQPVGAITYQQKKDMIFSCRRSTTSQQDEYHLLDRAAQVLFKNRPQQAQGTHVLKV